MQPNQNGRLINLHKMYVISLLHKHSFMHRSDTINYQIKTVHVSKIILCQQTLHTVCSNVLLRQLGNFGFKHSACSEMIKLAQKLTLSSSPPYTQEFVKICKLLYCAQLAEQQHVLQIMKSLLQRDILLFCRLQ